MKKYVVRLSEEQRGRSRKAIPSGKAAARELAHARVLQEADEGKTDDEVAASVRVSPDTVARVRRRFCAGGPDAALRRRPQPPRPDKRKPDEEAEAELVMLACSTPPEGHERWTPDLLADRMVRLRYVPAVSRDTVSRALKKTRKTAMSPGPTANFSAEVLDLPDGPVAVLLNRHHPWVGFCEPAAPGRRLRFVDAGAAGAYLASGGRYRVLSGAELDARATARMCVNLADEEREQFRAWERFSGHDGAAGRRGGLQRLGLRPRDAAAGTG